MCIKEKVNRKLSFKNVAEIPFKLVKKVMTDFNSVLENTRNEEKKTLLHMMSTPLFVMLSLRLQYKVKKEISAIIRFFLILLFTDLLYNNIV